MSNKVNKIGKTANYSVIMNGIVKMFPGVLANDNIDFDLKNREIHSLIGENGAGKSTLMNILYGLYTPDKGEIFIHGEKIKFHSPHDAINNGIGMIHQTFMLIPNLTVVENIILGFEESNHISLNKSAKKIDELSSKYGFKIDPYAKVWHLSVGEQQRVEIIKTLYRNAKILILDEPTSVLTPEEADNLFIILKQLTTEDRSIIFITHKIREALKISDRITILRKGKVVGTLDKKEANKNVISEMMIGQRVTEITSPKVELGKKVLELKNVHALNDNKITALKDFSLYIKSGEILGIAGVSGNGQKELAEVIIGIREKNKGELLIDGIPIKNPSPRKMRGMGVGYIPEDRFNDGVILNFTNAENLILDKIDIWPYSKNGILQINSIDENARELINNYDIQTDSPSKHTRTLSGGNIQKLLIARELSSKSKLLIASHPTMGLDIAATQYVREKIVKAKEDGCAVLLISEDLDEILALSDRIAVIYEGSIMGIFENGKAHLKEIGLLMAGVKEMD